MWRTYQELNPGTPFLEKLLSFNQFLFQQTCIAHLQCVRPLGWCWQYRDEWHPTAQKAGHLQTCLVKSHREGSLLKISFKVLTSLKYQGRKDLILNNLICLLFLQMDGILFQGELHGDSAHLPLSFFKWRHVSCSSG